MGRTSFLALALLVLGSSHCATPVRAAEPPSNQLTAAEIAEGWVLLFDGVTAAQWEIVGEYEVVDGALILGGKQTTRAYLKARVQRRFDLRFQYRTEGKESAGVGWSDRSKAEQLTPGASVPILTPREDWHDSFLLEYFDIRHFQQRFLKHQHGSSGVFAPIESLWIEVPAGNRLFLRNLRLRQNEAVPWYWVLAIPLLIAGILILFVWRWKKQRGRASPLSPPIVQVDRGP